MNTRKLMNDVIALEWEMFSSVPNSGRRAACQMDGNTFRAVRASQLCEWPRTLLTSYRNDLTAAKSQDRNLMTEKYAWMMESTFPAEFLRIAHLLPEIDKDTLARIDEIVSVNVVWELAVCEKYPKLGQRGRPVYTFEDSESETSFETYLRGELKTYSPATISELQEFTRSLKADSVNGVERDLLYQVGWYGYSTLEQAEKNQ